VNSVKKEGSTHRALTVALRFAGLVGNGALASTAYSLFSFFEMLSQNKEPIMVKEIQTNQ